MISNKKFVPVMLMPFTEAGAIDYRALDQLTDLYLDAGAQGLFANCLSSEMYTLSMQEMVESVQYIVDRVGGRVPIVATGSFGDTIEDQACSVKKIYQSGVSAVILITGLLAKQEDSEAIFRENVMELFRLTPDIPVGFYECPVPYKRVISAELLGEFVETGRVKYHKDTCLDIQQVQAKIEKTHNDDSFGLYDAYMVHATRSLIAGTAGLSCIQGNYFPELVVWLCEHYNDSSVEDQIRQVNLFFEEHMDLMHATYPASAKYVLKKRGIAIGQFCRNGSDAGSPQVLDQLDRLVLKAEVLRRSIC